MSTSSPTNVVEEDWIRRLRCAEEAASSAELGSVSFLQASSCPVVSVFITTGALKNDGINKRSSDLRFVGQHDSYPPKPVSRHQQNSWGYSKYIEKERNNEHESQIMSREEYVTKFYSICDIIDSEIRTSHGIKYFSDGDVDNNQARNVYYMHVCDIMNIIISQKRGSTPFLGIQTELLNELNSTNTTNKFVELFTTDKLNFLYLNIDTYYISYAYYSNHSFIPTRTQVDEEDPEFTLSSFFMNDPHFTTHQRGKLQEINQNEHEYITRLVYRSI